MNWYCKVHRYHWYFKDKQSAINYGLNYLYNMIIGLKLMYSEDRITPLFTNVHRAKAILLISEGKYEEAIAISHETGYQYNYLSIGCGEGATIEEMNKECLLLFTITQEQIDWAKQVLATEAWLQDNKDLIRNIVKASGWINNDMTTEHVNSNRYIEATLRKYLQ